MEFYYVFFLLVSSSRLFAFQDEYVVPVSDYYNSNSNRLLEERRANILEAPFMAVIFADISFEHLCPYSIGVIVSSRWILTTAKALKWQSGKDLKVLVGLDDITRIQEKVNTYGYSVDKQVLHSDYKLNEVYNDIALIKVISDIRFSDRVQIITLMTYSDLMQHEYEYQHMINVTVYNYGSKNEASKNYLKRSFISVNTRVVDLNERLFVAAQNTLPTCYGDSGSPAIVQGKLVGLLIVEYSCGLKYPNVFTGILHYSDWINNAMYE
ncbi:chymotrypsin-1-like isoform X1 [Belonocnema kinseyi]|uniref:chymotrypsin-1-like isoform X1 n=1 Tax=Belonocnema kinseyi TaxID=2817044 RepID=UPI00143D5FBC|nr:chymotrypsin-1-like isoform X1 [Belonocnema kinseyi]